MFTQEEIKQIIQNCNTITEILYYVKKTTRIEFTIQPAIVQRSRIITKKINANNLKIDN